MSLAPAPVNISVRARATRWLRTMDPQPLVSPFRKNSSHKAATPATCGHAMLVPLIVLRPPPTQADLISTPGATTCGLLFEKSATVIPAPSRPIAPTERSVTTAGNDPVIL